MKLCGRKIRGRAPCPFFASIRQRRPGRRVFGSLIRTATWRPGYPLMPLPAFSFRFAFVSSGENAMLDTRYNINVHLLYVLFLKTTKERHVISLLLFYPSFSNVFPFIHIIFHCLSINPLLKCRTLNSSTHFTSTNISLSQFI